MKISTLLTNALDLFGYGWWIEISTSQPRCTYYFGPYFDGKEARGETKGYIEDLEGESAQGIQTQVKFCKPKQLTIDQNWVS